MQKQIILTGLCFWSTEAIFQRVKGISETQCGYYDIHNFDFAWSEEDRLESVLISYNDDVIDLNTILDIYFLTHNPALVAWSKEECIYPLCRPAIFCFNDTELPFIQQKIDKLKKDSTEPFYTKVLFADIKAFKNASDYDQDFYNKRPNDGFSCSNILPKIEKLKLNYPNIFLG